MKRYSHFIGGAWTAPQSNAGSTPRTRTPARCDRLLTAPNDIVFDADGGFYFTDFGKNRATYREHGAIYYASADGRSIRCAAAPLLTPNGIALSPDGKTAYVAETETARLWAFDIAAPGVFERSQPHFAHGGRLLHTLAGYHRFDSMAVQANGVICVATMVSGRITRFAPDGTLIDWIDTGDWHTTNLCFGGPGLRTAYATLSDSMSLVAIPWPEPGLRLNFAF